MPKKLYIELSKTKETKTVRDLIDSLYREVETGKRRRYARPTYTGVKCTRVECNAGRRSFEDLLTLARTYFPDTTEEELMKVLKSIRIKFYFCNQIKKAVFHFVGSNYGATLTTNNFYTLPAVGYANGTYTRDDLSKIYESMN